MNKPIKKYRSGSVESAVWFNERKLNSGETVGFKTVSLTRSWRDDKNVWRNETVSLRKGDITKAILVLQKAQEDVLLATNEVEENDK